jgi:ribosomal protein L29
MAVQLSFDKCREIFKTLGTLKQGNLKLRFQVATSEIIVETEYTSTRSTRAVAESVSLANAYNRDLAQFRALVTMKMNECVRTQLAQTSERKLDARIVTDFTQEINLAIEGLRKLKDDQYKADADKSGVIERIINEDFQPLVQQMNPPAAAMSSGIPPPSPQKPKERLPSHSEIPAEVLRLREEVGELREQITQLKTQFASQAIPSSSKTDTLVVISIALNVIVLAILAFNFFQEG